MTGVTQDDSVFIIAEIGINHNGDLETAKTLISQAAAAGADAAKFQIWDRDEFVSDPETAAEISKWEFENSQWRELKEHADNEDIKFFASVFDEPSVDFLMDLGVSTIKVASGDITHIPLLKHIGSKNVDVILSTGASSLSEIDEAVRAVRPSSAQLHLLECVSTYPVEVADLNLSAMLTLQQAFNVPVGFSDHTSDLIAPCVAVGMGASIIEKHFTLDSSMEGPDHEFSIEPDELGEMVDRIRAVNQGVGSGVKRRLNHEHEFAKFARRGLKARREIKPDTELAADDLKVARPETGIQPSEFNQVVGRTATARINENEPITWEDI